MAKTQKRVLTAEDLYRFQLITTPRISPDGRHVIYSQSRVDPKTEKKYSNLWVAFVDGSPARQFTFGNQSDTQPRWSPDGSQLAFLSNRGDPDQPAQIHLIPFHGGEARPLTHIKGSIGEMMDWSPDGRWLLCTMQKTDADVLEREADEHKKKLGVVARNYDRLFFKLDGAGYLPKERWHLWLIDAVSGRARQLTEHAIFDEGFPTWSPDGKSIVFTSNRSVDPDLRPDAVDIFSLPIQGGEPQTILTPVGPKMLPNLSPDGKMVAYLGYEGEGLEYKNMSLWIAPLDGHEPAVNLTEKYDLHCAAMTINDMGTAEQMAPAWSLDGKSIFFQVVHHGSTLLMQIGLDGGKPRSVIGEGGVVGSFTLSIDQTSLAYFYGKLDDPGQIVVLDRKTGKSRQVTQVNRDLLNQIRLSPVKEIWFKGPAGNDLQGWVMVPPDFDPSRRYPSVLEIHGGPRLQYGNFFMHEFYYLAAQGYVVYFCNPRGGRGYGEAHTRAIWQDWGNADFADLMAWNDIIRKEPYIDPARMGVTGGSYGGYITVWIIGHDHRFQAAVTGRCVSNFISMWGSSDYNWTFQNELGGLPPFEDLETYWKHSPIAYIGNAVTPTMVIHNEFDLRCPIEQGEQVFVALKKLGVDSEMVRFPDEFHGLSRNGRTDRRIARLKHILRWFDKYLK